MHGPELRMDRGAGPLEVVARLAINGFRQRNGSPMTNNVATARKLTRHLFLLSK